MFGRAGEVAVVIPAGAPFESFGTLIGGETRSNGIPRSFMEDRGVRCVVKAFTFA